MSIPGIPSNTSAYFTNLINAVMAQESRPLTRVKQQKTTLITQKGLYTDLGTKFDALKSSLESLDESASSTANSSIFGAKTTAVTNPSITTADVFSATASTSAAVANYDISITTLAQSHQVRSSQQSYSDQALGLSGTIYVGGAASRATSNASTVANTITGFGTAAPFTGETELGADTYSVEVRQNPSDSTDWEFRMVDSQGNAVSIDDIYDSGTTMTSDWQDMVDAGQTVDTGRGLTFTIAASGSYTAGTKGSGAASVDFMPQGASIAVTSTQSLQDIADAINSGTYASGNGVTASVIDRYLVLESSSTGTLHQVRFEDTNGILNSLGFDTTDTTTRILHANGGSGNDQAAANASFTVNNVSVTRQSNTGLTDVTSGVTLNLLKQGESATLQVKADNNAVKTKINDFISKFNAMTGFLKDKTGTTLSGTTYTRGGLAGDTGLSSMRFDLYGIFQEAVSGLPATSADRLQEIGITLDGNLQATVSDSTALDTALTNDFQNVSGLFDQITSDMIARITPYTQTDGIIDTTETNIQSQIDATADRIESMNATLARRRSLLVKQYGALQVQMAQLMYEGQKTMSGMSGIMNVFG